MARNAQEILQAELLRAKEQLVNLDRQLQHRRISDLVKAARKSSYGR